MLSVRPEEGTSHQSPFQKGWPPNSSSRPDLEVILIIKNFSHVVAFMQDLWNYKEQLALFPLPTIVQPNCMSGTSRHSRGSLFSASAAERKESEKPWMQLQNLVVTWLGKMLNTMEVWPGSGLYRDKRKIYSTLHCSLKLVFLCFSPI